MPALTLGFAKVDVQLGLLRRRLNLRRLLDAVCLSGALAAAALSVLISSALRGTPATFSYTLWAIILLTSAATAITIALVRGNWLSLEQTARIADQQAQLEDRLSTLIIHRPSSEKPSRMAAVLLSQVLTLAGRWEPRTLVPVRAPRSLYVCLAALALLAATAFLDRRQPNEPTNPASRPVPTPNIGKPAASAVTRLLHPENDQGTAGHHARRKPHSTNDASGVSASFEAQAPGADKPGNQEAPTGAAPSRTAHGDPASSKVQTLIRQALGAEPLAAPDRTTTNSGQKEEDASETAAPRDSAQGPTGQTNAGNAPEQEQSESDGDGGKISARNRDSHGPDLRGVGNEDSARQGSGSGAGGTAGAAPFGPPGTADSQSNVGTGLRTFTIKLTETSRVVYTTMEHQPGQTGERIPVSGTDTVVPRDQPLDPQSSEERGLHRSTIPSEHEATVRRIFSRQADGG